MEGHSKTIHFPTTFYARYYLSHGLKPIPIFTITKDGCLCSAAAKCDTPGKHPMMSGWKDFARDITLENFKSMWPDYPCNIGIATGRISNIFVIDLDPKHDGVEKFKIWEAEHGKIETTWRVITGSGGYHLYLKYPSPDIMGEKKIESIANQVSKVIKGVDFRADGGLVVAPPSLHISGREYQWEI